METVCFQKFQVLQHVDNSMQFKGSSFKLSTLFIAVI